MKKLVVLFSLIFCTVSVYANEKTWIKENYEGKVIVTPEYIIEIPSYDSYDTRYWSRLDDILILDNGYIINLDNGEKAEIKRMSYK